MRIAQVVRYFNKETGKNRIVYETFKELSQRGWDCHIFSAKTNYPELELTSNLHRVPILNFSSFFRRKSFDFFARHKVGKNFDVIHGHGEILKQDVLTVHNVEAKQKMILGKSGRPSWSIRIFEQQLKSKELKKIIVPSKMVKNDLIELYEVNEDKIVVNYPGINTRRFSPPDAREKKQKSEFLRAHGFGGDEIIFGFVASGQFKKRNFSQVIRAFSEISAQVKNAVLLVVGGIGKEESKLIKNEKRIIIQKFTSKVEEFYKKMDVFVLPVKYEEFGLCIQEAMASALPVITTQKAGAAELITDRKNGFIVGEDFKSIANTMREVLSNMKGAISVGIAARESLKNYTWKRYTDNLCEIYSSIYGVTYD